MWKRDRRDWKAAAPRPNCSSMQTSASARPHGRLKKVKKAARRAICCCWRSLPTMPASMKLGRCCRPRHRHTLHHCCCCCFHHHPSPWKQGPHEKRQCAARRGSAQRFHKRQYKNVWSRHRRLRQPLKIKFLAPLGQVREFFFGRGPAEAPAALYCPRPVEATKTRLGATKRRVGATKRTVEATFRDFEATTAVGAYVRINFTQTKAFPCCLKRLRAM